MFPGIGALPEPATGSHVVTRGQRSAPRKCNQPTARRSAHGSVQRSSQENGALCFCLCLFVLLPVIVAGDAAAPPQPAQPSARRGPSVYVECLIGKQKKSRSIEVVSNGVFFEGVFRSFLREFFGLHLSVASVLLLQFCCFSVGAWWRSVLLQRCCFSVVARFSRFAPRLCALLLLHCSSAPHVMPPKPLHQGFRVQRDIVLGLFGHVLALRHEIRSLLAKIACDASEDSDIQMNVPIML
jgi:hypothetical protein